MLISSIVAQLASTAAHNLEYHPMTECETEPDITMLMASIIRLLALEQIDTCTERRATLTRLLNYLAKHPAVCRSPHIAAPIGAAIATSNKKLVQDEFATVGFDAATNGVMH